jgi:hypothetical protein
MLPFCDKIPDGQETDEFVCKLNSLKEDGMKIRKENKGIDSM